MALTPRRASFDMPITPTEHALLAQIEKNRHRSTMVGWRQIANDGAIKTLFAIRASNRSGQRECLITAAAHLVIAAELLGPGCEEIVVKESRA